jgi:hypothetical protein
MAMGNTFPMPTEPAPVTVAEVVHVAVEVCSGGVDSDGLDLLLERFEDADEPVSAVGDIEQVVAEAIGAIAGDDPEPELQMAGAVIVYLAHRRDQLDTDPAELLRLAAGSEYKGHPPPDVAQWLEQQGVSIR